MNKIRNILKSLGGMPDTEIERFMKLGITKYIRAGSYFIREGEVPQGFAYIKEGLFRYVYISQDGNECTYKFAAENDFVYDCRATRNNSPIKYSIQALEDSIIFEVDYHDWVDPFKDTIWWNKLLVRLIDTDHSTNEKRERELLLLDAEERYRSFLEDYGEFENRIKQYVIASYLGITPVSLSRVRKKLNL